VCINNLLKENMITEEEHQKLIRREAEMAKMTAELQQWEEKEQLGVDGGSVESRDGSVLSYDNVGEGVKRGGRY
jgi:hypothetical protein